EPLRAVAEANALGSLWAFRLRTGQEQPFGVLAVFASGRPAAAQVELIQRYARQAALAVAAGRRRELETSAVRLDAAQETGRAVTHESGQSLAIIAGYAELIAEGLLEGEALRDSCQDLVAAAGSLADILQRFERIRAYVIKEYGRGRTMLDIEHAVDESSGGGEGQ